jgi:small conductance mechanosensitive channel
MAKVFTGSYWTSLLEAEGDRALHALVQVVFIIILYLVARFVLNRAIAHGMDYIASKERAAGKETSVARIITLGNLLKSVSGYVLFFVVVFTVLMAFGINLVPVLTAAGVAGFAVGFGAQKLVRDVISGFFILLEDQYAVGDYVTIGAATGVVEEIGMRTTRLRDDDGRLIILGNGDISVVANHSRGGVILNVDVSIASDSDLDKAEEVLNRVGKDAAKELGGVVAPFKCEGIISMDSAKVTLRLSGRIKPEAEREINFEVRRRAWQALMAEGIRIA